MPRWVESWEVESRSKPGEYYTVSRDENGDFGCSCLAWTRQRKECKHIRLMKGQLRLEPEYISNGSTSMATGYGQTAYPNTGRMHSAARVAKSAPVTHTEEQPKKRRRYVL